MTAAIRMTVVVPALDEERDIAGCIDALGAQDLPLPQVQLVVVDAASRDRTRTVVRRAAARYPFGEVLVLDNPARRTSMGLNVGLEAARGPMLARVDARSRVPAGYLRACEATLLARPEVGVVGGAQVARARSARRVDRGIAGALRNRWATGLSRYRRSTTSGPSDTVWMGVFRTTQLRELGGWSAAVALNEDWELNARYRAAGATVWFDAGLRSDYLPRRSLPALARQYFGFGRVKGTWWARGQRPAVRQLAVLLAPLALGALAAAAGRAAGPAAAAALPVLTLAVVERGGRSDRPGEPAARATAAAAIAVLSAAWWTGAAAGFVAEQAHGSRRSA